MCSAPASASTLARSDIQSSWAGSNGFDSTQYHTTEDPTVERRLCLAPWARRPTVARVPYGHNGATQSTVPVALSRVLGGLWGSFQGTLDFLLTSINCPSLWPSLSDSCAQLSVLRWRRT
ncbi:hypothetical protein DPEC_G00178060 [Dallia pectoralis]|uniref:Uncharacterized protein n=1 Tax=Dallia pectoralis TaxID=75939 RepID=A0ACC2GFC6_DALPE|nr:hypothetical protein DPEC_G00178060 [Dallia pectoralis]